MLITIVMSVYNSEQYLEKAIHSVLEQTYKDFEFIIIDDGSTDGSVNICRKYAASDKRIVFIQNEGNLGLAASLNKGIKLAKGTYIARQDADDLSSADRLEVQLKYALENPDIDVIGSDCYVIDIADQVVFKNSAYSRRKNLRSNLLDRKAIFPHGSAFVKKEKLLNAGMYDPRFYYVQDGELWLRLISLGAKVHVINKPLYFYRTGPVSSNKRGIAKGMFNNVLKLVYSDTKNLEQANQELEKVKLYLSKTQLQQRPYYMAEYWKSLGNAAYFNSWNISVSYKYIRKALNETNSISNYPKYLILSLIYLLPPALVKPVLKIKSA